MKILVTILFFFVMLMRVHAQNRVSIENFDKISDPAEREKLINQAPTDQRAELEKIDMHHMVLTQYGGEVGLRSAKRKAVARNHGFTALTNLFEARANLCQYYVSGSLNAYERSGISREKLQKLETQLNKELDSYASILPESADLVYQLAVTPQAVTLEKKAARIEKKINAVISAHSGNDNPITAKERLFLDKEVDQILSELKTLPQLSSAQLQKEYDEFPEKKLYRNLN